jgi:uncharacterized protein (DUF934 family)
MPKLILRGAVANDPWTLVEPGAPVPATGAVLVPLDTWLADREALAARTHPVGVWLDGEADPTLILPDVEGRLAIAIRFPKFADGRGISLGKLLRERHGFRGELRAFGDFLPDQAWELSRSGFDAFVVPDARVSATLAALATFSDAYQASTAQPLPLFRRRAA